MATLTITSILASVSRVLPQVSYIKLADWYLIISVFFVYLVFAEFTLVLWLTEKEMMRIEKENKRKKEVIEKVKQLVPFDVVDGSANNHVWRISPLVSMSSQNRVTFKSNEFKLYESKTGEHKVKRAERRGEDEREQQQFDHETTLTDDGHYETTFFIEPATGSSHKMQMNENEAADSDKEIDEGEEEPEDDEDRESQGLANTNYVFFIKYIRVAFIDEVARLVFPLAYLIFNIGYWWYFFINIPAPSLEHPRK